MRIARFVLLDDEKKIKDLYLGYERELFNRRFSFELLDDLNCLRLQLVKIALKSSDENECLWVIGAYEERWLFGVSIRVLN